MTEPRLRVGAVRGLPEYLDDQRADISQVLCDFGLPRRAFDNNEDWFSLSDFGSLLQTANHSIEDGLFWLNFSKYYFENTRASTAVGFAQLNAPDIRSFLNTAARYRGVNVSVPESYFEEHDGVGTIVWSYPKTASPICQYSDFIAALLIRRIHAATGPDWRPISVDLTRKRPPCARPYHAFFGDRVRFNQPKIRVSIDRQALSARLPGANPTLHNVLIDHCEQLLRERRNAEDPVAQIVDLVIAQLSTGSVTLEGVAESNGTSPEHLQRHLKKHGTSFQAVVEQTRRRLAHHYLIDTDHSFTDIAFLLGFSELSAFSRAAKRWFGTCARDYRREPHARNHSGAGRK